MNKQQRLAFNAQNISEFRASGGTLRSFGDAPVLLLTTTGARSGARRTTPLMYMADEDAPGRVFVFASAAGAASDPAWFRNLAAHPDEVTVEIGRDEWVAEVQVLPEPDRGRVFAEQSARYSGFAAYQAKTARPIPVVALTREKPRS